MKRMFFQSLAGALLLSCASTARALDSTPAEAERLTHVFEAYLGKASVISPPWYTLTPAGASYDFAINLQGLYTLANAGGAKIETIAPVAPFSFRLTPQPDGKWGVKLNSEINFGFKAPTISINYVSEGLKGDSLFDPSIPGFVSFTADLPKFTAESSSAQPNGASSAVNQTMTGMHQAMTATATPDGVESGTLTQSWAGANQHLTITVPGKKEGASAAPPTKVDIAVGPGNAQTKFNGARNRALMGLWAWLLSHPTKESKVAAQAEFKQLARAAIPLFDKVDGAGSIKTISATTQVGVFSAQDMSVGLHLTGAVEKGFFGESIGLKNLAIPAGLAPPWAKDLMPRDIDVDFNVGGLNVAAAAQAIIDGLDFSATPPLPKEVSDGLQKKLLASGAMDVNIANVRFANAAYEISMNANVKAGPGQMPSGGGTIRAKGLDAIAQALTEAAKTDKNAMNAVGGLAMARALAKPGPDGTSIWNIAYGADGKLTINGQALGGGAQK